MDAFTMSDYRQVLFEAYDQRTDLLDTAGAEGKVEFFRWYATRHYRPHLSQFPFNNLRVLDVGCNRGYLLKVLHEWGIPDLHGIDLSPVDVEIAGRLVPSAHIYCADAFEYLHQHSAQYDVIITKAVLEHIPKNQVFPFLEAIQVALKPNGMVLVDVPNMDWLLASHERYMDFTHEVGFTIQSLQQVMGQVFQDVRVLPADNRHPHWKRSLARALIGALLRWADDEITANPIWARSIVGVGRC